MIVCKELNTSFETKELMFEALRTNKADLIAQKKMQTKYADAVCYVSKVTDHKGDTIKADTVDVGSVDSLKADLVINTTKIMDSHSDVHLDGIWSKSVKEQKNLYLLQEHKMSFKTIITDKVKASVKKLPWSEVGANFSGDTEALVFSSEIDKSRNEFMFDQYAKGFVKNHSVGMRYVKLDLALDSESKHDQVEKEVWDQHIDSVVNKSDAEAQGYFWAVGEAKIIEGSAVPVGSNQITPVLNIQGAGSSTPKTEPSIDTQNQNSDKELLEFYKHLK